MKTVSIIIPIYNEEKSLPKVLSDIKKIKAHNRNICEIIAVDDGSTDNSAKIVQEARIKLLRHTSNKGYGAALKTGISAANGEYILIIDADGTYPVDAIPTLIKLSSKYDMVVGARTGKHVTIPLLRRPAKWILNKLANYLTDIKIPDLNSGLRIFKKDIALRFFDLFPDGFSFTATITIAALTNNYNVKFVPINYYKRESKSSIKPIRDFSSFFYLILRLMIYFKPAKIFLPTSAMLFIIGFIKAMRDFILFNYFGVGAVMVILTSIQLGFLGLIADLVIKRTKL